MQWNKQTETPLNGWLGMQEKLLKGWWDVLAQPQSNGHAPSSTSALWELWQQPWQTLYQENSADAVQQALAQFLSSQEQGQRLLSLVSEAWQSMFANASSPAEWQTALTAFSDQLRQQLNSLLNNAKLMENSAEFWRLYAEEAQKFTQPWLNAWWQTPAFLGNLAGTERATATTEFMQLYQAAFEQTWGRALMAPSMGLLREFNEKVNKGFALWLENQQVMAAYQLVVGEAWVDAFQALMQKLIDMAQKGETFTDVRHLMRIWVEVADEVFIELFHSDAYAKAQSAYVNSNMALQRQQRELLEVWLRKNDMPTRTDLDEAHQQIYQLRKEVKALKKSMSAKPVPATPAPPKAKTAKSATGKRRSAKAGAAIEQAGMANDPGTPNLDQQAEEGAA